MPDPSETPAPEVTAPEAPSEVGRLVAGPGYCVCPNIEAGGAPHIRQQNCPPEEVPKPSPFDPLFVNPDEAARLTAERDSRSVVQPPVVAVQPMEKDEPEEGEILAEAVKKIGSALEKLGRRGLNMRGVIALLHDANPAISKKAIKAVLEGLRELPAIYGQDPKRP